MRFLPIGPRIAWYQKRLKDLSHAKRLREPEAKRTGCLPRSRHGSGKEDQEMLLMQMGLMFGFLVVFVTVGFAKQPLTVK